MAEQKCPQPHISICSTTLLNRQRYHDPCWAPESLILEEGGPKPGSAHSKSVTSRKAHIDCKLKMKGSKTKRANAHISFPFFIFPMGPTVFCTQHDNHFEIKTNKPGYLPLSSYRLDTDATQVAPPSHRHRTRSTAQPCFELPSVEL